MDVYYIFYQNFMFNTRSHRIDYLLSVIDKVINNL